MSLHRIFAICFFIWGTEAKSQVRDSGAFHSIAVRFGVNQIRENNLMPKVHRGTSTEIAYGHERKIIHWNRFHLNLGYSRIKTKLEDVSKSANLKINSTFSRNYRLAAKPNYEYFLGPELCLAYNASIYADWDDSHLYWADYLSLGVSNIFSVRLRNGNHWVSALSLPVFSLFSRPDQYRLFKLDEPEPGPIIKNLNSDISPGHLGNVLFLRLQTEYRVTAFGNKSESFFYMFQFERVMHNEGKAFVQIIHQVGIKLYL